MLEPLHGRPAPAALISGALLLLSACGGGGRSDAPPTLGANSFTVAEDGELTAQLSATDPEGGSVTFAQIGNPASGTVASFTPDGVFVYRPDADVNGTDSFGVEVTDPAGNVARGTVNLTITPVNDPPRAVNDVLRVDGAALAAIDLLANDADVDGDTLTVTIEEAPFAGSATVNDDGSVRLEDLPAGFRGLTRLRYTITDPDGESDSATAAIFSGTDPFRVVFAGEATAGEPEAYMTDFVSPPWRVTLATQGSFRLRGFVASDNGATVVYRRENGTVSDLSFVRTTTRNSTADEQVRIELPGGYTVAPDQTGADQYAVSPNGRWIAVVARQTPSGDYALYVLDVDEPTTLHTATPDGARFVTHPRFSVDSRNLYFLASDAQVGTGKSLYRVGLEDPSTAVRLSIAYTPTSPGEIHEYAVSPDQRRIALHATREGREGIFFIDAATPESEIPVNHALALDEIIVGTTVGMPPERGGPSDGTRVAYTVLKALQISSAYVADLGANPNPRLIAQSGARAVSLRADGAALLYSRFTGSGGASPEIYEAMIDTSAAHELVGAGFSGLPDASGEVIVVQQVLQPSGAPALAVARRGAFGTTKPLGTPGLAAWFSSFSGIERAVVLLGEGPAAATAPTTARIALVNAWVPDALLYLAEFETPLNLTAPGARIVTY